MPTTTQSNAHESSSNGKNDSCQTHRTDAQRNQQASNLRDYDYIVVGSGFGGSVAALRLAEKGWRVALLEQGERIGPEQIKRGKRAPLRRFLHDPKLPLGLGKGFFRQWQFKHVGILGGVGLGGGSLVWGAVMLPPKPAFYEAGVWRELGIDMRQELAPHLKTAQTMLGVVPNPFQSTQDDYLQETATTVGRADTYGAVPQAIYFGSAAGQPESEDPFFGGTGPSRTPCRLCGECLAGCEYGSKNALPYNYLYFAEKAGVDIHTGTQVTGIQPEGDGYALESSRGTFRAARVVLAAGVIGTLDLLLRARDEHGTLPQVSAACGRSVRTNSEALTGVLSRDPSANLATDSAAISSDFYPDANTHVTQNRLAPAMKILRPTLLPMSDGTGWRARLWQTVRGLFSRDGWTLLTARRWTQRMTILTTMQNDDSGVAFRLRRTWTGRRALETTPDDTIKLAPSYLPVANAVTRRYADISGGIPMSSGQEAVQGKAVTAHILGGCAIGPDASTSVIDANHEVHGHPGLFVVDGAAIPANLGVNPSLTITAMAERFASLQPDKVR